jgi:hypothetical protein
VKQDRSKPHPASWKGELYRQSRLWHGYLSAFAFLALIFFAGTGLVLNHPEWTPSNERASQAVKLTLPPAELAAAKAAANPSRALAAAVGRHARLLGAYQSGEVTDGEAMLRLEGPRGATDVTVEMASGATEVSVQHARLVDTLDDLHRGKNAGQAWRLVIDLTAAAVLALSIIGYVLFFTLRFRLRTALILTAASLVALVGVAWGLTP